jgi:RND superfamily putative drug exporter
VTLLAVTVGGSTSDGLTIPGTESQRAGDLLAERFPAQSGSDADIVFAAPDGTTLNDLDLQSAVSAAVADLAQLPGVVDVSNPFEDGGVSSDGSIAYAVARFGVEASNVPSAQVEALMSAAAAAEQAGVQVEFGGEVIGTHAESGGGHSSELVGLGVAVIVLLFAFGSVIAMGLPLLTALLGVGIAMMAITLFAGFLDMPSTAPVLAMMIGLAVGIDYALFIVTRHRQNLAEGLSVAESAARANATAGGAVVFAGVTVVIALAGLSVVGIPLITLMGLAAAMTVLVAIAIAVTLIPAMLGFAGSHIDRWRIGRARTGSHDESYATFSSRWARKVTERPGVALAIGLGVMLLLAVPALSLRLGMTDAGSDSPSSTTRQAYDLLAEGFGPGFNGPLVLVMDLSDAADPERAVDSIRAAVAADSNVLEVGDPLTNPAGDTAVARVMPRTGPSDAATEDLVHRLRDEVLPGAADASGAETSITGSAATDIDLADKMSAALPIFVVLVVGLTILLLLMVFRSVVVPIKAAIAILLSIASSFGVLVAIFQWGWLKGLVGLEETVPIIAFIPIIMFAILFGLSMDYEVFIMSRIREDFVRTGQPRHAVLTGLTSSARVITAAALIMISVFGSFVLGDDPIIKMFGIGLSVAVLLDATVVRMVIVPAVMALLDRRAWWLPAWLDRRLPNLDVEGEHLIEKLQRGSDETGSGARSVVVTEV